MQAPPSSRGSTLAPRNWLKEVTTEAKHRPSAIVMYGPAGIGKSTLVGNIKPKPVMLPFQSENTWSLLKESGSVPSDLPILPPVTSWLELLQVLEMLATEKHGYKFLAIDTLSAAERLCHEHVCERDFQGDWGERGFSGYARGPEISLADWREFLNALDRCRDEAGVSIVLVGHSKVAPHRDPRVPAYDRFVCDCHHKTWSLTHRWADSVLFLQYHVEVDTSETKNRGRGGRERVMYCSNDAAYDAKNRWGLKFDEIDMGSSGAEAWSNLVDAIKHAKSEGEE